MQHLSQEIKDSVGLHALLDREDVRALFLASRSVLVQAFSSASTPAFLSEIARAVGEKTPGATVIGGTSAGEIAGGHVLSDSTVLSVTAFEHADLLPFARSIPPGEEDIAARELASLVASRGDVRCVLLFLPALVLNAARFLQTLSDASPGLPVFGGVTALVQDQPARVLLNDQLFAEGAVAVALCGPDLDLTQEILFDWHPLGPLVTLTDVEGCEIRTVDSEPAIELYRRNLNISDRDDLYLLEFPLLIERKGIRIARNPLRSGPDGAVTVVGDVYQGETARLGFLDANALLESISRSRTACSAFHPQAIFSYSCVCRKSSLQSETEIETMPFEGVAPTSGFFTYGEFGMLHGRLHLLNSSAVIVALRETATAGTAATDNPSFAIHLDAGYSRHIRLISRLFQFIGSLTEQIEEQNRILAALADMDPLTGTGNRRSLDRELATELVRAAGSSRPLSIAIFDLDHFKQLNDRLGHSAGDEVLKQVASVVRSVIRGGDRLYRYGGEEFVIILPDTPLSGATAVAENARAAVASRVHAPALSGESNVGGVTASFGVARFPEDGNRPAILLEHADAALYRAKDAGRNCVRSSVS